jgi:acyl-[acyl-carrier-protein]-phospholipid O-acyltransferase/long-chain-fatty-acid--[acyl-carrier-protein] ligase
MNDTSGPSSGAVRTTVTSGSFLGLLVTQFLGALNDNMFRWLAVPIGQSSETLGVTGALVLGGVCFTFPYLLLAPAAGSLADRFSKRSVIVWCKVAEIVLMALGVIAIAVGDLTFLFITVTAMGAQSALFAPSKFGALPEMLRPDQLSKGNGLLGMATVVASALGTVAGFWLFSEIEPALGLDVSAGGAADWKGLWPAALALVGTAVLGTLSSLWIAPLPAVNPARKMDLNPVTETWPALRLLFSDVRLARTALGIAFFWMLASLAQLNIDPFGEKVLGLEKEHVGILMAVLVSGLGFGSVLAGWWSGGRVELGIVPLGALGIICSSLLTFLASAYVDNTADILQQMSFYFCCAGLFLLGTSAGLFDIPLEAYLQVHSDDRNRGTILAGSNFVAFACILLSCGLFYLMHGPLGMTSSEIFMAAGLLTVPVAYYVFQLLPAAALRFVMWLLTHTVYRVRVRGEEHIPAHGGALIVANHVSFVDGLLLLTSTSRMIRFVVYADYAEKPLLRWMARTMGVIPIKATGGARALVQSIQLARDAVANGEVVCIFPEGSITRSGQMQSFNRGMLKIVEGTGAPIIPAHLHGLWGSIFSYFGGKFFWKRPRRIPYPVAIQFGEPIASADNVHVVRQAVERLGTETELMDNERRMIPIRQFIRQCKRRRSKLKIADSAGTELNGAKTLAASLAFRRVLERQVFSRDERTVGLLLPPSVGGALANLAVSLSGRTTANLNYTLSDEVLNYCVKEAGIRHVLTSRRFLEKKPVALQGAEFVFLEDLKEQVSKLDKALAGAAAYGLPSCVIDRMLGLHKLRHDDPMTIIFTSGSTGEPKGVVLTHANIGANIAAVDQLLNLTPDDCLMGVLPFFHSFGFTVCLWLVMCFDAKAVYHFNPLDAKMIGTLSERYAMTILLATPTFLKMYLKRCTKEQFSKLDLVVVGAEKLPQDLAREFEAKFGIFPSEGYGTTELSPVASCNIPEQRLLDKSVVAAKPGSVGRPIPGVSARVVDPDTFADRGLDAEGLLLIKGANVMSGYLNQPAKTTEVVRDGWYVTGDYAKVDSDGFIHITGRMSRFSKIGGEMVPHIRIEQELMRIVDAGGDADDPELKLAVTAVPCPDRGERLVVLHKPLAQPVEEVLKGLQNAGLPNLWLPSRDSFVTVEKIPVLGTGKLDLRGIKQIAGEHFG